MRTDTSTSPYRYELPTYTSRPVDGDSTGVSEDVVEPTGVEHRGDLLDALAAQSVELRFMDSLRPCRDVWDTTLHAIEIRLCHARNWPRPGGGGHPTQQAWAVVWGRGGHGVLGTLTGA